jgi:hypothetical protein
VATDGEDTPGTGLKGLLGSVARALGGAFMESLERQMRQQLADELGSPELRKRMDAAERVRGVLGRPEFPIAPGDLERLEREVRVALTTASTAGLLTALTEALARAEWRGMQRLMFLQLLAPNPNLQIRLGTAPAGPPPVAAPPPRPPPHLRVVPNPEPDPEPDPEPPARPGRGPAGTPPEHPAED